MGDGVRIYPDALNCLQFVNNVETYLQSLPCLFAHVALSKTCLNVSTPGDQIEFSAALKGSVDPQAEPLSIDREWVIRLRHENGLAFDAFRIVFVAGACAYTYTYQEGIPLGAWHVDDTDFDRVTVQGQSYQVKLAAPVGFTIYRELPNG